MTVSTTENVKSHVYSGYGDYTFSYFAQLAGDLVVSHVSTVGVTTVLVKDIDYTVVINPTTGPDGGTITVLNPTVTIASSVTTGTLRISRDVPLLQGTEWANEGPIPLEKLEYHFDRIVLMMQQLDAETSGLSMTLKGAWTTGVAYPYLSVVYISSGSYYICVEAHTAGTWATDLAAGLWQLFIDFTDFNTKYDQVSTWQTQTAADAVDTAADAVDTAADAVATAADRVQTGLDVIAAAGSATDAAASAAGVSLPSITSGDATKILVVKDDETGYDHEDAPVTSFYDAYVHVADIKAQGVDGGTFTQDVWQTRDIEEIADTANIASVASNVLTLAAGTYRCRIWAPAYYQSQQARLYDNTGAEVLLWGTQQGVGTGEYSQSVITGRFTLAVESELEIEHKCTSTRATTGLGRAINLGPEVYTVGEFWRES